MYCCCCTKSKKSFFEKTTFYERRVDPVDRNYGSCCCATLLMLELHLHSYTRVRRHMWLLKIFTIMFSRNRGEFYVAHQFYNLISRCLSLPRPQICVTSSFELFLVWGRPLEICKSSRLMWKISLCYFCYLVDEHFLCFLQTPYHIRKSHMTKNANCTFCTRYIMRFVWKRRISKRDGYWEKVEMRCVPVWVDDVVGMARWQYGRNYQ